MFGTSYPGCRHCCRRGTAGSGLAGARCDLAEPHHHHHHHRRQGRRRSWQGQGRRPVLAAGGAFASKHQPRQVSPVSQPALAVGRQPGLHHTAAAAAPARPPACGVPALTKTNPTSRARHAKGALSFPPTGVSSVGGLISPPMPGAGVVAPAVPCSPVLPAHLPRGPKCRAGLGVVGRREPGASAACLAPSAGSAAGWSENRRSGGFQKDPSVRGGFQVCSAALRQPHPSGTCSAGTDWLKFIGFFSLIYLAGGREARSALAPGWHGHHRPQLCATGASPQGFPSLFRSPPSRWMRRRWTRQPRPRNGWIPAAKQWMWRR